MPSNQPLNVSDGLLKLLGTRTFVYFENRIPDDAVVVVVSNHRSFMDPMMLMVGLGHSLRTACHHYMGEIPGLREAVHLLGCFPLANPSQRGISFLQQGKRLLQAREWIAIFPEGGKPVLELTPPDQMHPFHEGFAHLLLRANLSNLVVLPVAIASLQESISHTFPIKFLHWLDPSEELFNQWHRHPMVIYHRVNVLIGRPYWITPQLRQHYRGRRCQQGVRELTDYCQQEIQHLLASGCR